MNRINPKELFIIKGLPPICDKSARVALDLEIFGMDKKRLHRPDNGTFASLQISMDGKTVYVITDEQDVQRALDNVDAGVWIFHNTKFDITHLRRWAHVPQRKRLWDTMLIEQIRYSGYYTDFSLADLARRYLGIYMEKETREEFAETDIMTQEMLEYSAIDVVATWRIYQAQRAEIDENDLQIWKDIELPFLWVLLGMGGTKLDTGKWLALAEKNGKIADEIQTKYGHIENTKKLSKTWIEGEYKIIYNEDGIYEDEQEISPGYYIEKEVDKEVFVGINLNSPKQVKDHLAKLGYKVSSTDVTALEEISDECEFAKDMLVYRTFAKRSSTYGKKFVEDYVEKDGRIYGDIFQMGAETGRTSSRSPNLQNQPHEFEYRDCFVAGDGNCLIIGDWGSQEPRIAAYWSQDANLIEALNSEEKLYIRIAREALEIKITKKSQEYDDIKSTILGLFYGMSAKGLAARIGRSEEDSQHMIDKILATYPGIAEYMERQSHAGEYVQSIYGRKIWLNHYLNQWKRNALNAPIQSSAADAMKIAAYKFLTQCHGEFYRDTFLKLLVHDELVLEVPQKDCEKVKKLLAQVMVEVAEEMHDGIKGSAEVYSGASWASKA